MASPSSMRGPGDSFPAAAPTDEFHVLVGPGEHVYQTNIDKSRGQDSSTPLRLRLRLSTRGTAALLRHGGGRRPAAFPAGFIKPALRRFDGKVIRVFDMDAFRELILEVPVAAFAFHISSLSVIDVDVHRKHLPVSKNHSNVPFRFVFCLADTGEVAITDPFFVGSKQPTVAAARPPPKRIRGPPAAKPIFRDPTEEDRLLDVAILPLLGETGQPGPALPDDAIPAPSIGTGAGAGAGGALGRESRKRVRFPDNDDVGADADDEGGAAEWGDLLASAGVAKSGIGSDDEDDCDDEGTVMPVAPTSTSRLASTQPPPRRRRRLDPAMFPPNASVMPLRGPAFIHIHAGEHLGQPEVVGYEHLSDTEPYEAILGYR